MTSTPSYPASRASAAAVPKSSMVWRISSSPRARGVSGPCPRSGVRSTTRSTPTFRPPSPSLPRGVGSPSSMHARQPLFRFLRAVRPLRSSGILNPWRPTTTRPRANYLGALLAWKRFFSFDITLGVLSLSCHCRDDIEQKRLTRDSHITPCREKTVIVKGRIDSTLHSFFIKI